jgi:hypothetical protein
MSPTRYLVALLAYLGTFAFMLAVGVWAVSPLTPAYLPICVAMALMGAPCGPLVLSDIGYLSPTLPLRCFWTTMISGIATMFALFLHYEGGLSHFWSYVVTLGVAAIGLTWWLLTRKRKPDGSTTESH